LFARVAGGRAPAQVVMVTVFVVVVLAVTVTRSLAE
jgi:hypothetical protein